MHTPRPIEVTMVDVDRPAEFRDEEHLCQWLADQTGQDVNEIRAGRREYRARKAAERAVLAELEEQFTDD